MGGRVRPGEPWKPDAGFHNRVVDLLSAFSPDKFRGQLPTLVQWPGAYWVKNNTGGDLSQFEVVGIGGVENTPSDNEEFDARRWVVDGETPVVATHTGKFAICLEPIKDGKAGLATSTGVVPAIIEVDKTWHEYADIKASVTELKTKPGGGVRILWQESGTGTGKRALVQFGATPMVMCGFNVDSAFTTTDGTETADIDWCNIVGYNGQNITLENHDASSDHIFEGDAADKGTAWYDVVNDKWRIIQMECP